MLIDTQVIPFDIGGAVKSKAYHEATPEQRQQFVSNATTFATMIDYYADKYRAKKTLKGEFIACVLRDFYWDMLETPCESENLDENLTLWYEDPEGKKTALEIYSEELLDQAIHAKRWIKILKATYKDDKESIRLKAVDNRTGRVNLNRVNDFSEDYRDILY